MRLHKRFTQERQQAATGDRWKYASNHKHTHAGAEGLCMEYMQLSV